MQYLVIGLIGLMLWGKSFLLPPPVPVPEGPVPLYRLLYSFFSGFPHLAVVAGFVLVLFETWWINVFFNKHELTLKNSSLASLVFIIMMSSSPLYLTMHPLNTGILIIIIILDNLMKSYKQAENQDLIYKTGFLIAVGSLVYFPFLLILGIIPVSFVLFRSGKWREVAASVIGFITPFIFLAVFYFLSDQLAYQAETYKKMILSVFFFPINLHIDDWIIGIFTLVLAIWGLYYLLKGPMEKTAEIRAKTYLLVWLLPISVLSAAYSRNLLVYHILMLIPPLTLLLTSAFLGIKKKRWAEIIFLIYFLIILINSYFYNPG